MWVGAVDGGDEIGEKESTSAGYTYTMNLNTSFTVMTTFMSDLRLVSKAIFGKTKLHTI